MQNTPLKSNRGVGTGSIILIVILVLIIIGIGYKLARNPAPTLVMREQVQGIGVNTPMTFEVRDPQYAIKKVQVDVLQNGKTYSMPLTRVKNLTPRGPSGWKLWSHKPANVFEVSARVGRKQAPALHAGHATLVIAATNDSWGRFFRGGKASIRKELPVRFAPPQVDVLTTQHYINQGGCDMVLFKVSPGTTKSGVEVGKLFFPSFPVKESTPEIRLAVFSFPWNVDPSTPAHIVATDDAGNTTIANFDYKVFPKKFHESTLTLSPEFLNRVVPPIMAQSGIDDQGSILKNFLYINGHLRLQDAERLIEFSKQTNPTFYWTQPFIQLGNSKVEAYFADARTYIYNSQVVDHQTHLGYDLAVVAHTPIPAANDGKVVYAGWLDIYGNAAIIDHGCGVQTLYGHMASIDVSAGDTVKRGQIIGRSDSTGLAGGDHLHFSVLLDGLPVNPTEWWDPHWIHDRIEAKLQPYQQSRVASAK
ncbi:MAG: M23 family metallopeptidase [Terriglobia bacterium]